MNARHASMVGAFLAGSLLAGASGPHHGAGDLTNVTLLQSFDPVRGVRLIEASGSTAGKSVQVWLMIEDRNFLRLTDCGRAGTDRPGLSYSERSHMVSVVTCGG